MSRHNALAVLLLSSVPGALNASAHELRPAYLELRQTTPDTFEAPWKVPAVGERMRLALSVRFPDSCVNLSEPRRTFSGGAHLERWWVHAPYGLSGQRITVDGLAATMTDVLVRVERLDGTTQVARLTPSMLSFVVEAAPNTMQVAGAYTRLGIEHILSGVDHLLYILAMLYLVTGWRHVVAMMSAFTATHSLTLTAATLGWVHVLQPPVEACIALSIVCVAREIVCDRKGQSGLTARWPWVVSFTFGLQHGLGFAGALSEVGLPQTAIPVTLLFFNVGVEIGQLLFIAAVVACMACGRTAIERLRFATFNVQTSTFMRLAPAYAIGSFGKGGTGTILVNGAKVAEGRVDATQCCVFSIDEGADVGLSTGTAVSDDYAAPFTFTGSIERVTIELKGTEEERGGSHRLTRRAAPNEPCRASEAPAVYTARAVTRSPTASRLKGCLKSLSSVVQIGYPRGYEPSTIVLDRRDAYRVGVGQALCP